MTFATAGDLAEFTGDSDLDSVRGELLVEQASALIRNHVRQTFTLVVDDPVELRGTWSRGLQLPERPVVSVDTVTIDGDAVTDFDRVRDVLYRHNWDGPEALVEVTYTHGFDTDTEAWRTLKTICLQAAGRAAANPQGLANWSSDGTSINFRDVGLTAAEQAVLDRFDHEHAA